VKAYAVIGAQYGDEGKGLMVDHLSGGLGGSNTVVVRSNGGSQAAHTVVTPEGQRHVFSHFGSGSFAGASTHLSRYMIVNPIKFREERTRLLMAGCRPPRVSVDPGAMVTLPFDALINQIVETQRGNARHGSCGQGIGETVERNEHERGFPLTVGQLRNTTLADLRNIRDQWVPYRLEKLGNIVIPSPYDELLRDNAILEHFINDCGAFLFLANLFRDEDITRLGTPLFEAAQGLALDAEMGAFPYVTRSNTGLKNIAELCALAGIDDLRATYVTRVYTTRHGAGPLDRERDISADIEVIDPTNIPNDWQGSLRFAPLDASFLIKNIERDLENARNIPTSVDLLVTCLDQIRDKVSIYHDGIEVRLRPEDAGRALKEWTRTPIHESWGPSRTDILVDQSIGSDSVAGSSRERHNDGSPDHP
jgi:adenylosuccinate synthase